MLHTKPKTFTKLKNLYIGIFLSLINASYPILSIAASNINRMELADGRRYISYSIIFFVVMYLIISIISKSSIKSIYITTASVVFFYFYGHVYKLLNDNIYSIKQESFVIIWFFIFTNIVYFFIRLYKDKQEHLNILLVISLALIIQPISRIIDGQINNSSPPIYKYEFESFNNFFPNTQPDIYYIILDAYSRDDVLIEYFDLDNNEFLTSLEEIGFYVAKCSQSNYAHTKYSLGSSLNLNYIQNFYSDSTYGNIKDSQYFEKYIQNNETFALLKTLGYKTISFETNYSFSEHINSDFYFSKFKDQSQNSLPIKLSNDFEYKILQFSIMYSLKILPKDISKKMLPTFDIQFQENREILSFTIENLKTKVLEIQSPKFIFAHLLSPHEPHHYGSNGELVKVPQSFDVGYRNQVKYINGEILTIIEKLIESSKTPPIIVIQGDHGAQDIVDDGGQLAILNAYYGPQEFIDLLYPSISPVNSFRYVFNFLFDTNYEYLEDISYYSNYNQDYEILYKERDGCEY